MTLHLMQVIFVERPVVAIRELFADAEVCALPACDLCMASHVPNPWGERIPEAQTRWPKFFPLGCQVPSEEPESGKGTCKASYCHR